MGLSNKLLLGLGAGAVALAFVGVGANASFTDVATAGTSITTGTVGITMYAQNASYKSEGVTNGWNITTVKDATPGSANDQNSTPVANGFQLAALPNVGSDFTGTVHFNIQNNGSLPVSHLQLAVTDPGANTQLAKDTVVSIVNGYTGGSTIWSGSLASLEKAGGVDVSSVFGTFSPNQSHWLDATFTPPTGGYTDADAAQTIAPVFTVTGSDA